MYLATATRPDIATAASQLSRFFSRPTKTHLGAARHLLRYLNGSKELGLSYNLGTKATTPHAYSDATYASDPETRRSVSGQCTLLNGGPIHWKSKLQTTVALSTAESEFLALCDTAREVVFTRNLLTELNFTQDQPTTIYEDNQPVIHQVNNNAVSPRMKHVAIRFEFIRELISSNVINVIYCETSNMIADLLTKNLKANQFATLRAHLVSP